MTPKFLYHSTGEENLEAIVREGIKPSSANADAFEKWGVRLTDPMVWLSEDETPNVNMLPARLITAAKPFVCIKVNVRGIERYVQNIAGILEATQHPENLAIMKESRVPNGDLIWPGFKKIWVCGRRIGPERFREIVRHRFEIAVPDQPSAA
jgi:hypothetical protein